MRTVDEIFETMGYIFESNIKGKDIDAIVDECPYKTYTKDELRSIIPDVLGLHETVVGKVKIKELRKENICENKETLKNVRLTAENIVEAVRIHQKKSYVNAEDLDDITELANDVIEYINGIE